MYACLVSYILYSVAVSVSFNQSTYIANENDGSVQAVLFISKSVESNITIEVITNDSTATGKHIEPINNVLHISNDITGGGVDYNSGPYNVTFPAGETSVSFSITINNDTVLEDNETFNLNIAENSLPENVTLGVIYLAKVIILSDGEYAVNHLFKTANAGQ